ncbi:MAG: MFS transporter [Clostridiales bacterium]|nr:MFS transporter [Clostridiales bacterium]
MSFLARAKNKLGDVGRYWKTPPEGRYMTFREIISYSFGGIGAYFIIQLGSTLIVSTTNIIVSTAIGVGPTDGYIIYLLSAFLNIPLTGIRADMVDNTRGKGGKYRPYLLTMGIPTALISVLYVWFPYEKMYLLFPGQIFGHEKGYLIKCVVVAVCNLLLLFFFNFFNDAYSNLIHVLSPDTQERTDVLAIKSVVYSLAPSIMNIVNPMVAKYFANDKVTDIRVYRISYPVFALIGIALTIVVYANTGEKIIQAKTHTIQVRFTDALREVAKNKYFWIISLAGWLGFLELTYQNILVYSQSYGHTATGNQLAVINTLVGNASLWGMLAAPFCIRRFGKKKVLVFVNLMNVVCILMMLINIRNIWWLFICIYINCLFGSFEQITTPAIQADIRDYQQYRSGERIDGMFAAVAAIGNLVTLVTSSFLPAVQRRFGIYEGNGYANPFDILDVRTGNPGLFYKFLPTIILMAAVGAFLNVVPYLFYDFNEKKQKGMIRVLKIRSLFEDHANGALKDEQMRSAIEIIESSRENALKTPVEVLKRDYRGLRGDKRREAKKAYKDAVSLNEEIEISEFVCREIDKFDTPLGKHKAEVYSEVLNNGVDMIKNVDIAEIKTRYKNARYLPKNTRDEREERQFELELLSSVISAHRTYKKHYGDKNELKKPDMNELTRLFEREDELSREIFDLNRAGNKVGSKAAFAEKKRVQKSEKLLMDEFARYNRAMKPFSDAEKFFKQKENYSRFDEIKALSDK